jgi:serine/threonine protein kinase
MSDAAGEWLPGLTDPVEIGRGGFGVVYRATETDLNRTVAVKVLSGTLDDLTLQRFDRERRAMGALSGHPNIVGIYRTGLTDDNRPYLVMEYLTGGSMLERIDSRGPLPWREAAEFGVRLCAALETAHRAGVLHRDVKPENVFVSSLGAPKLGDFGIARLDGAPQTQSAVITASLAHAAPEIIDGKPPSVQSDIFALASTVITLMRGTPPFSRPTDESIVPLLARIATEPVPDMRPDGVPAALCEVFETAMAKDPAGRYPSMAEFGRALQEAQRQCDAPVTPLEVQGIDPTVQPGAGAPRVADPTVDVSAPLTPVPLVPPVLPPATPAPNVPAASVPASPAPGAGQPQPHQPQPQPHPVYTQPPQTYATGPAPAAPKASSGNGLVIGLAVAAAAVLLLLGGLLLFGGGDDSAGSDTEDTATTSAATSATTAEPASVTTLEVGSEGPEGYEVTEIPFALGDDLELDQLAAECSAGLLDSCDDLYIESPIESGYEQFGGTCGARSDFSGDRCSERDDLAG